MRGSVLLNQGNLRNQFGIIAVKLAFPGTDGDVQDAFTKKPAETQRFIFSLSYSTLGSILTFTPANMCAPVDALETRMPNALDSWIAGLAQTSGEADASRGEKH